MLDILAGPSNIHHWYMITHLEVPVHNVMLVDVTDALQDLIDAVAGGDTSKTHLSIHNSWLTIEYRLR